MELLPCPFCGKEPFRVRRKGSYVGIVKCKSTGCSNSKMRIEDWNTRTVPEGYVLVPVEVSEKMLQAGAEEIIRMKADGWNPHIAVAYNVYQSMVEEAQKDARD